MSQRVRVHFKDGTYLARPSNNGVTDGGIVKFRRNFFKVDKLSDSCSFDNAESALNAALQYYEKDDILEIR